MSRLPLTDRPYMVFPAGLEMTPAGYIKAPLAILVMAAVEHEHGAPAPVAAQGTREPKKRESLPPLAKCLPSNVVQLSSRKVG